MECDSLKCDVADKQMGRPRAAAPWSRPRLPLEQQLKRELHLPSRSRIPRRGPRIRDDAERRAANDRNTTWLSKIRLVEKVEDLRSKLHAPWAAYLDVL